MDIMYISNGVLLNSYIEGENIVSTHFYGYYYKTKVFDMYVFVNKENHEEDYISISIKDGGFHSSPYTTKAIKKLINYATEWLYNDFGDIYINNAMLNAYNCIKNISEIYFEKYRKCDGKIFTDISYNGRTYRGYFSFNY